MGLPAPLLPQNTCHHENDFISVLELATSMLLHCERAFPGFSLYIGFGLGCLASPDRGKSRCSLSCPCSFAGFCSGPRVSVLLRIYSRGHCFPVWSVQPWTAQGRDSWDGGSSPEFKSQDILAVGDIISACVCTTRAAAPLTAPGAQLQFVCAKILSLGEERLQSEHSPATLSLQLTLVLTLLGFWEALAHRTAGRWPCPGSGKSSCP